MGERGRVGIGRKREKKGERQGERRREEGSGRERVRTLEQKHEGIGFDVTLVWMGDEY